MGSDSFLLSSNEFPAKVTETFKEIYKSEKFTDVTLITEDFKETKAHRLALISCSKVLDHILSHLDSHNHPVIYLRGILHENLQYVLQFIYHGEVTVPQDSMGSVLSTAQDLKIYKLSGVESEDKRKSEKNSVKTEAPMNIPILNKLSKISVNPVPHSEDRKNKKSSPSKKQKVSKVQEVTEDIDDNFNDKIVTDAGEIDLVDESHLEPEIEYLNDDDYDDTEDIDIPDNPLGNEEDNPLGHTDEGQWNETQEEVPSTPGKFDCTYCGAKYSCKSAMQNHVDAIHLKITYPCSMCEYSAKYKGDLRSHILRVHEGRKFKCPHCEHESGCKSNLKKHIAAAHNIEGPKNVQYPCNICDSVFFSSRKLTKHIQSVHKEELYADMVV